MLLLLSDRTINQDLGVNLEYCYLMADRPKRPTEQHRLRRRTQLWVWRRTSVSNERSLRCEYLIKWCAKNAMSRNIDTTRVNFFTVTQSKANVRISGILLCIDNVIWIAWQTIADDCPILHSLTTAVQTSVFTLPRLASVMLSLCLQDNSKTIRIQEFLPVQD